MDAREHTRFPDHRMDQRPQNGHGSGSLQQQIAHEGPPYSCVWKLGRGLPLVNTVVYGLGIMSEQLSARDWLDLGLKVLARSGFAALKAEKLAKMMGVSRGSFYWHFADIAAFHAAILKHWR